MKESPALEIQYRWEETDVVTVDQNALAKAQSMLAGCEECTADAEIPFDWILDRLSGKNPAVTDYVMEAPIRRQFCGSPITEKTLVDVMEE